MESLNGKIIKEYQEKLSQIFEQVGQRFDDQKFKQKFEDYI